MCPHCRLQISYCVWQHLYIWPLSDNVWELSERRQTAYRWIHSFQGLYYLAQMFDCHSPCLCNLASHLKGSSRNANKANIHHICHWLMSCSHQGQPLPPLMFVHTLQGKFHLKEQKGPSWSHTLLFFAYVGVNIKGIFFLNYSTQTCIPGDVSFVEMVNPCRVWVWVNPRTEKSKDS